MTYSKESQKNAVKKSVANSKGVKRQKHTATAEKEYSSEELEFMMAMHEHITSSGNKFPSVKEILSVLDSLGYKKE